MQPAVMLVVFNRHLKVAVSHCADVGPLVWYNWSAEEVALASHLPALITPPSNNDLTPAEYWGRRRNIGKFHQHECQEEEINWEARNICSKGQREKQSFALI